MSEFALHASVAELCALLDIQQDPSDWAAALKSSQAKKTNKGLDMHDVLLGKLASLDTRQRSRFLAFQERLRVSKKSNAELDHLLQLLGQVDKELQETTFSEDVTGAGLDTTTLLNASVSHKTPLSKSMLMRSNSSLGIHVEKTTPGMVRDAKSFNSFTTPGNTTVTNSFEAKTPLARIASAETLQRASAMKQQQMTSSKFAMAGKKVSNGTPLRRDAIDEVPTKIELKSLRGVDAAKQEAFLIEDLLYVLLGMNGEYIQLRKNTKAESFEYFIEKNIDPSLRDLVAKLMPLTVSLLTVNSYIERRSTFQYGRVSHALCAAIRDILKEFFVLVAQLEHQAHTDATFSLQKVWFYLGPSLHTMEVLAGLISALEVAEKEQSGPAQDLKLTFVKRQQFGGAQVLNILSERMVSCSGDPESKKLHQHLFDKSVVPYLTMLSNWLFTGEVNDPFREFLVNENHNISKEHLQKEFNDVYWEQRYILNEDAVPSFLESTKENVLLAGKFLNVIRECDMQVPPREEMVRSYFEKHRGLFHHEPANDVQRAQQDVVIAYDFANQHLLQLLLNDNELLPQLRVIKQYFLLEQSDFLTQFLDVSIEELHKPCDQVPLKKLQNLFELVIRSPTDDAQTEAIKDSIKLQLDPLSLFEKLLKINSMTGMDVKRYMTEVKGGHPGSDPLANLGAKMGGLATAEEAPLLGMDTLMLGFQVQFPLSLVLNKKILTKYQLLFRQLFQCKYLERLLMGGWLEQTKLRQAIRRSGSALWEDEVSFVGRLSALSGKMLHFVQQVMFYMFFEIIGPNWDKMEKALSEATRVDQVLLAHDDFLNTCLKECMLMNPKLLKGFNKLAQGVKAFAQFSDWYCRYKGPITPFEGASGVPASLSYSGHPGQASDALLASHSAFSGLRNTPASASPLLSKMEKDFIHTLRGLMDLIQVYSTLEAPSLVHLLNMMDFNHFYSTRLAPDVGFVGSPVVQKIGLKKEAHSGERRSQLGQSSPFANY